MRGNQGGRRSSSSARALVHMDGQALLVMSPVTMTASGRGTSAFTYAMARLSFTMQAQSSVPL